MGVNPYMNNKGIKQAEMQNNFAQIFFNTYIYTRFWQNNMPTQTNFQMIFVFRITGFNRGF